MTATPTLNESTKALVGPIPPYRITREQQDKLLKAVSLAKHPGLCTYVRDAQPSCVIAQLAILEGVQHDELLTWVGAIWQVFARKSSLGSWKLNEYPEGLLQELQIAWDSNHSPSFLITLINSCEVVE